VQKKLLDLTLEKVLENKIQHGGPFMKTFDEVVTMLTVDNPLDLMSILGATNQIRNNSEIRHT
jgi:hypothetical protein